MLSQRTIEKKVADALASDDRWRVIVRGNNWLCPYCLKIGARDLRMDEAIEEKLALHFVRDCTGWNYFNSEPQTMERLRQRARYLVFKLRVLRWMTEDRRFRFFEGERWICPYDLSPVDAPPPSHPLDDLSAWGAAPESPRSGAAWSPSHRASGARAGGGGELFRGARARSRRERA